MYQSTYYVPKEANNQADMIAGGFTSLLYRLMPETQNKASPIRTDKGAYYQIDLPDGLSVTESWLHQFPAEACPLPFIKTNKAIPPADFPNVRDSDEEWEQFKRYINAEEKSTVDPPRPDFPVIAFISDFRMQGLTTYNKLAVQWWDTRPIRVELLKTLLALFADPVPLHYDKLMKQWTKTVKKAQIELSHTVTASQMFNPHTGKGANRTKADAMITPTNVKLDWLLEYLKALALYTDSVPYTARGGGLRKSYVLAPQEMPFKAHREIFKNFRGSFISDTAVKMDIMAALHYTKAFLDYVALADVDNGGWDFEFLDPIPHKHIQGFYVTTYQQLSANAYTMMNQAFIRLPEWAEVTEAMTKQALQDVLTEHIDRIRAIDENRSEGYNLLNSYRDFICGNQWDKLFEFFIAYGRYTLSQLDRGNYYIKPFSEKNIRRLLMTDSNYSAILDDKGFQNVAKAIRYSTIVPQYIGRRESLYEVRYGLGQKFKKSAHYKEDFLTTLADFMHSYNEENGLKQERLGKQYRENLTKEDVRAVVALVDQHDPELICNLLLAYGFARDPKDKENSTQQTTEEQE